MSEVRVIIWVDGKQYDNRLVHSDDFEDDFELTEFVEEIGSELRGALTHDE